MATIIQFPVMARSHQADSPLNPCDQPSDLTTLRTQHFTSIAIVDQAMLLLESANCDSGIKLTETGSLNRKLVQDLWARFDPFPEIEFKPTRENEYPDATRIRQLLEATNCLTLRKKSLKLTIKGRNTLLNGPTLQFYHELFNAAVIAWDWGFADRYPDFHFIQDSAYSLLQGLRAWPTSEVTAVDFAKKIFKFKNETGQPLDIQFDSENEFSDYEEVVHCLNLRLFQRFCVPFGLLSDLQESELIKDPSEPFRKTDFMMSIELAPIIGP